MKELRLHSGDAVVRIAFAFDPEHAAILLIGVEKQGVSERRFYRKLIDRADALFAAHLRGRGRIDRLRGE